VRLFVLVLLFTLPTSLLAEEIRDFYSEPGLHPFDSGIRDLNEKIEPFSGKLHLDHTDLTIPGNGGMDINITRFYTSPEDFIEWSDGIVGIGWTMHFGRLVVPAIHKDKVCSQSSWNTTTADNPSFEHPDGARELLVLAADNSGDLVTKSNWRFSCNGGTAKTIRSPDGRTYVLGHENLSQDGEEKSWHTTSITDQHNNRLEFTYTANYEPYIEQIEAFQDGVSDGRLVTFDYVESGGCKVLDAISANARTWRYQYIDAPGFAPESCKFHLEQVELPTGLLWQYEYHPNYTDDTPGRHALQRVTYPRGGVVEYDYQEVKFDPSSSVRTIAVSQKRRSGREVTNGTWDYVFEPSSHEMPGFAFDVNNEPTRPAKRTWPTRRRSTVQRGRRSTYTRAWAAWDAAMCGPSGCCSRSRSILRPEWWRRPPTTGEAGARSPPRTTGTDGTSTTMTPGRPCAPA
jgi:hypothetical protein